MTTTSHGTCYFVLRYRGMLLSCGWAFALAFVSPFTFAVASAAHGVCCSCDWYVRDSFQFDTHSMGPCITVYGVSLHRCGLSTAPTCTFRLLLLAHSKMFTIFPVSSCRFLNLSTLITKPTDTRRTAHHCPDVFFPTTSRKTALVIYCLSCFGDDWELSWWTKLG